MIRRGAFILLILLAAGLRLSGLDRESLFMDEIRQVSYYTMPFREIAGAAAKQQQPPLDYWIGYGVSKIASSDFFVRLPAALFGIGSVVLLCVLLLRRVDFRVMLLFGLTLACSPYHIYFSQDARPYSIAIFFLLAYLIVIERVLREERPNAISYLLVLLISVLFLLSRTLSPLVFVTVMSAVLTVECGDSLRTGAKESKRFALLLVCMVGALLVYAPTLLKILLSGSRFLTHDPTSAGFDIGALISNVRLVPIYRAFIAQFDPVGPVILVLTFAGVVLSLFGWTSGQSAANRRLAWLLVLVPLLHSAIFHSMSIWPLRPPYLIYLLPLGLVMSAISVQFSIRLLSQRFGERVAGSGMVIFLVIVVASTLKGAWEARTYPVKTDWRGATQSAANEYGDEHVLLFAVYGEPSTWEPTFYGFNRYPKENVIKFASLRNLDRHMDLVTSVQNPPALMIFNYRDYRIRPASKYSILPVLPGWGADSGHLADKLAGVDGLHVTKHTGITLVSLTNPTGNLALDLLDLLRRICAQLPDDAKLFDFYFSIYAIAKQCGLEKIEQEAGQKIAMMSVDRSEYVDERINRLESHFTEVRRANSACHEPDKRIRLRIDH